jgi:hypothetical protein
VQEEDPVPWSWSAVGDHDAPEFHEVGRDGAPAATAVEPGSMYDGMARRRRCRSVGRDVPFGQPFLASRLEARVDASLYRAWLSASSTSAIADSDVASATSA